jgi:amidase
MSGESGPSGELEEATIAGLQADMVAGRLSARRLVEQYLERSAALDRAGPTLRAIIDVNPDALEIAEALDRERASAGPREPLQGISILLKDNSTTADRMGMTAGSLALVAFPPRRTPLSPPGCARLARFCWARPT